MSAKIGRPRENQSRSLTRREREILRLKKLNLLVKGTRDGFDLYCGSSGNYVDLNSEARERLMAFWSTPTEYVWGTTRAQK